MTEIRNIKVTIEEKNLIINNGADKLPLNPTSQGFSGQSVRKQLSQAVTGARGSVLALMIEKFSIIEDFSNTVLLVEVKAVGDDLTFIYADGREFKFPLDVITNGLVKFVNDKSPDENGRVVINIDDISELRDFITSTTAELFRIDFEFEKHKNDTDNPHEVTAEQVDTYVKTTIDNKDLATLQEAKDYTYSQVDIDNKDTNTLQEAKDYTYSQADIDNKDATKVDKTTTIIGLDLQDNILIGEFRTALGNATQSVAGLLSAEDKTHLDGLVALLETSDGNNVVDTIGEILAIFQNYPEGADLVTVLQGKVDKVEGKGLSTNDLTDILKDNYDTAYAHSQIIGSNPHQTTYAQLLNKPTTIEQSGILNVYNKEYIDTLKNKNGWKSELLGTLENNETIALSIINQYDEIQMYAKDTLGVTDNENIRPSLMQSGDKVYFFDDTQAFIMVGQLFLNYSAPVGHTLQVVGLKYTELVADDVRFDGSDTNYLTTKTEVESAVKELDTRVKTNADRIDDKQDKLVAGNNITIVDNTISASGGSGSSGDGIDLNTLGYMNYAADIYYRRGQQSLFSDAWQDMKDSETVLFDIPLTLAAPNQEIEGLPPLDLYVGTNEQLQELYDACVNETITPSLFMPPVGVIDATPYYVNNVATYYMGNMGEMMGFPTPLYAFGFIFGMDDTSFLIADLTPLEIGLGLVLAKVADVSIPNNNIVIQQGFEFENENGIIIPNSVTSIGDMAFVGWASNNQPLVIPNSVTNIGSDAFGNWASNNQPLVILNSVTSIGERAFTNWQSNNQPLIISNNVTTIGHYAFTNWEANNQPLVIPDSVTSIGDEAFYDWSSNNQPLVISDSVTSIEYYAFGGWSSNNQPLVIPNSVTSIGEFAFGGWSSNNQPLVIPNSVTSIGEFAFENWTSNNQPLVIPNSVTTIARSAFRSWSANTHSLVIPNSITEIGNSAFADWLSVKEFIMEGETPPTLTTNSFGNTNNAPFYVPDDSVDDYKTAPGWSNLASRIFPMSDRTGDSGSSGDVSIWRYE